MNKSSTYFFYKKLLIILVTVLFTGNYYAQITNNAAVTGVLNNASNVTISYTNPSGTNQVLMVGVSAQQPAASITSIKYNGVSLTKLVRYVNSSQSRVEIWYLKAPAIGTHSLVVTNSQGDNGVIGVMTFSGVNQVGTFDTYAAAQGSGTTASVTASSATNDVVYSVTAFNNGSAINPGSLQTEYWDTSINSSTAGEGSTKAGASSVTMTSKSTSNPWTIAAVSLKPASVTILDNDGDGNTDNYDLDEDNDGISDVVENSACDVPEPNIAPGNGVIVSTLFKEDFGTMSTAVGTKSVSITSFPGASTNYNYYEASVGSVPTNYLDGSTFPYSLQDGRYTIFNNIQQTASYANILWQTIGDHTVGGASPSGGRMYIVNASYPPGEFYRRTITNVVQGAPVNASVWIMNLDRDDVDATRIKPNITVKFVQDGITIHSYNTGNIERSPLGSTAAWKFFKSPSIFIPISNNPIDIVFVNNSPGGEGNDLAIDDILVYQSFCDYDNDGIPNYLDNDSDNDGCPDAIEGDENVTLYSQLNANGSINYSTTGGIGATGANSGIPNIVNSGGSGDVGSDAGQGYGSSYDSTINACRCYKSAVSSGTALNTNHGITALGRAGADNSNWPMVRKGAWTVLEAKTKGFVVNRLIDAQINAIPGANLKEGMMVYNITQDCLQINIDGTPNGWKCFNSQTCPDLF